MASVDTKLFIFGGMKLSKFCSSVLNILETDQTITQDKAATLKDTKGKLNRKPTLIRSTVKRSTIFKR
jgi:predicted DNA-binding ArsR family transcriptional regulator